MAVSGVDQKMLGKLASQVALANPLLSSALYQVLGLSVLLARKLLRGRQNRTLDFSRDSKSIQLYHHIIWLSREGLGITEVFILPYCQSGQQSAECRIMAAKLRASFYHVFCLFHNHPRIMPLHKSTELRHPQSTTGTGNGNGNGEGMPGPQANDDGYRHSMASETSYVTNPFAEAPSPPPKYPVPPIPTSPSLKTPRRPPGLPSPTTSENSPSSSASYLMPPLDFIPYTMECFSIAATLAKKLLAGSDPMRLSVMLEYSAFLADCVHDFKASAKQAKDAVRAVYTDEEEISDESFEDSAELVRLLTGIARSSERSIQTAKPSRDEERVFAASQSSQALSPSPGQTGSPAKATQVRPMPPATTFASYTDLRGPLTPGEDSGMARLRSPATAFFNPENTPPRTARQRSRTSSRSTIRSRLEGSGTEKERKRRAVQRAEQELQRRNGADTEQGTRSARRP